MFFRGSLRVNGLQIWNLEGARAHFSRCLSITLEKDRCNTQTISELQQILAKFRAGRRPVSLTYQHGERSVTLPFNRHWMIQPNDELLDSLKNLLGETWGGFDYGRG